MASGTRPLYDTAVDDPEEPTSEFSMPDYCQPATPSTPRDQLTRSLPPALDSLTLVACAILELPEAVVDSAFVFIALARVRLGTGIVTVVAASGVLVLGGEVCCTSGGASVERARGGCIAGD